MSNVLIGILGVILFIGLAFAGAVLLGSDFMSASSESRAAAAASLAGQISAAIDMYEIKTGNSFQAGIPLSVLQPRFLRTVPSNPTGGSAVAITNVDVDTSSGRANYVLMDIGGSAEQICSAIARQNGQPSYASVAAASEMPTQPVGCVKATTAFGQLSAGSYYAYSRTSAMQTAATTGSGTAGGSMTVSCARPQPYATGTGTPQYLAAAGSWSDALAACSAQSRAGVCAWSGTRAYYYPGGSLAASPNATDAGAVCS